MYTPISKNSIFSRIFSGGIFLSLNAVIFSGALLMAAAAEGGCPTGQQNVNPQGSPENCQIIPSELTVCLNAVTDEDLKASGQKTKLLFCKNNGSSTDIESKCSSAYATFKSDKNDASKSKKDDMKSSVETMKTLTDSIQTEQEKIADKMTSIQEALQKADVDFKEQQAKLTEEGQKADADLAQQKRSAQNDLIKMNQQMIQMQGQLAADQSSLAMVINMGSPSIIQNTCNNSVRKNAKESGINIGGSGNSNQVQSLDNMWKDCVNLATTKADGDIKQAQAKVNATKAGMDGLTQQIQQLNQAIADMDLQAQKATALRAQKMTDLQVSYTQKKANLQADLQRAQMNSQSKIAKAQQQMKQAQMMAVMNAASGGGGVDGAEPFLQACCSGDGAKPDLAQYENKCKAAAGDGSGSDPLKTMGTQVGGAALQMWMMNGAM